MPTFGVDELLEPAQIDAVVEHVLAISGQEHDAALATEGAIVFAENCAACHMEDGTGDRTQGAPNLTDAIWLYGGDARRADLDRQQRPLRRDAELEHAPERSRYPRRWPSMSTGWAAASSA